MDVVAPVIDPLDPVAPMDSVALVAKPKYRFQFKTKFKFKWKTICLEIGIADAIESNFWCEHFEKKLSWTEPNWFVNRQKMHFEFE